LPPKQRVGYAARERGQVARKMSGWAAAKAKRRVWEGTGKGGKRAKQGVQTERWWNGKEGYCHQIWKGMEP